MSMAWTDRLRGWWRHGVAQLREGYEAQLLVDAQAERADARRLSPGHPGRELRIPIEIRPRTVAFGELLRPVFLQFTLPCLAVTVLAEIAKGGGAWRHGIIAGFVVGALWLGFKAWFFTAMGRWIFGPRWKRLRDECYDRWQWRAAAIGEELPPARDPHEAIAGPRS